jgi:predicted nucleic acid-binding Zn ribbon protein
MQKFSDAPLGACPDCQGPVTKLMSMSSFALKGSGWYTTDYKRKGASADSAKSTSGSGSASS